MYRRIYRQIFKSALVHLYCIVFLYLTTMIKIVNNANKDRLMYHFRQNMERQTRSKKLASWSNIKLKCSNILAYIEAIRENIQCNDHIQIDPKW